MPYYPPSHAPRYKASITNEMQSPYYDYLMKEIVPHLDSKEVVTINSALNILSNKIHNLGVQGAAELLLKLKLFAEKGKEK